MNDAVRPPVQSAASGADIHPPAEDLARVIDALASGRNEALPGELRDHVENCPQCQGQILDVHFYLRDPLGQPAGAEIRRVLAGTPRRSSRLLPSLRTAAAILAFSLLALLYFFLPRQSLNDSPPGNRAGSPGAEEISRPVPQVAGTARGGETGGRAIRRPGSAPAVDRNRASGEGDAFAANPNLETMVASRSRSFMIEVYSPANHAVLSGEITFAWKEFNRESLNLTIVNNRNETIFASPAGRGVYHLRMPLAPGCYYWKLESATELFYVGKFFIAAGPTSPGE